MKKIIFFTILIILFSFLNNCGYKPIYSSSMELDIKIINNYIEGDKQLGQNIYSSLEKKLKASNNTREVNIYITASSSASVTSKDSTGKALEYKITINTAVKLIDNISDQVIIDQSNTLSQNYKVQDQLYESERLKNKTVDNLIDRIVQKILINIAQIKPLQ